MAAAYAPEPAGSAHAGFPGHVREATTVGSLLPERPELAGLLLADCSCGAEYTVPEGGDEFGALEAAHLRHVTTMPLAHLDERRTHLGLTWMTKGPRGRQWVIGWNEAKGDVKGWDYKTGRTGFLGVAGSEEEARAEALRIAALIAAGKTKED